MRRRVTVGLSAWKELLKTIRYKTGHVPLLLIIIIIK